MTNSDSFMPAEVSAVLCTRNAQETLSQCISSLLAEGFAPKTIIVVDGNSEDETLNIAAGYGCTILSDQGAGFTAARKLGVDAVKTEFTLILGPDDALEPGSLELLLNEIQSNPKLAALQARKRVQSKQMTFFDRGMDRYYLRQPSGEVPVVGNPSIYRTNLLKLEKYDGRFPANEDTDWCTRMKALGYFVTRSELAEAVETESFDAEEFKKRWRWYGSGDLAFITKYWPLDKKRAVRHFLHPFREYVLRLSLGELVRLRPGSAWFMFLCAHYRYTGLFEAALKARTSSAANHLLGR